MSDLTVVFRSHSYVEANIVRSLLDAHGLQSVLSADARTSLFSQGPGGVSVSVLTEDAEQAQRIIETHRLKAGQGEVVRMRDDLAVLEDRIGYRFTRPDLLERALTHRSLANEDATGGILDNESLEFLGDAVLGFTIADALFRRFPEWDEGQKSKVKSRLVSTATLARLAKAIDLGEFLILGKGEEKTGGRRKQALLADGFEALIAGIYVDGGIDAARAFILRQFEPLVAEVREPGFGHDHKSSLQEYLQAHDYPLPEYLVAAESGPDHRKIFQVEVRVRGEVIGRASGRSKKEGEQEAARVAREGLGEREAEGPPLDSRSGRLEPSREAKVRGSEGTDVGESGGPESGNPESEGEPGDPKS